MNRVVVALEKAAELDPSQRILELLANACIDAGKPERAAEVRAMLREMMTPLARKGRATRPILALKD